MKQVVIIILFLLISGSISPQQVSIINQRTIGGNSSDELKQIIHTIDNGFIIAGDSRSGISGEKTDTSKGFYDFWILKCDSLFNIEWQRTIGGTGLDYLTSVIQTDDGNFLCLGISNSPISGDKTCDTIGDRDLWLLKLDNEGNILWQKAYGGTDEDDACNIIDNGDGTYILTAYSKSDSSGTKTENSRGDFDYWIIKIDGEGNVLWDKTIGGSGLDMVNSAILGENNSIYLVGYSESPASGEKTEDGYGLGDCWVVKLDGSGNFLWDKTLGGDDMDVGDKIVKNGSYFYISCSSHSDSSGTKTENSRGYSDYWIIKIDENGNLLRDKTIGGTGYDSETGIYIDDDGNLFVVGASTSPASGEKVESSKGSFDYWVLKLDTNFNILWQKDIGGNDYDEYPVGVPMGGNSYIVGGTSSSNASGDKNENSRGWNDYWIVKLSVAVDNQFIITNNLQMSLFPNPAHDKITVKVNNKISNPSVFIYDSNGKKIMTRQVNKKIFTLDIRDLQKGSYILQINGENGIKGIAKFVKE